MTFVLSGYFFVIGRAGCLSHGIVLLHQEWPTSPFGPYMWYCELLGNLYWLRTSSHSSKFRHHYMRKQTIYFRSKDLKQVVKPSWLSDLWPPEADLLRRARDHGVEGVAKLLGHRPITSIEELRDGLILPGSHLFRRASRDAPISSSESQSPHDAFSIICRPSKLPQV